MYQYLILQLVRISVGFCYRSKRMKEDTSPYLLGETIAAFLPIILYAKHDARSR